MVSVNKKDIKRIHDQKVSEDGLTIYPFARLGNETFINDPRIRRIGVESYLKTIKDIETKKTDIILSSSMKSGTHWIHEILSMLLTGSTEYNNKGVMIHMLLDIVSEYFDKLDDLEDPRLFTTHLPLHHLPTKHLNNGHKIINMNRNPKDRWVSTYVFLQGKCGIPKWTWNEFFDQIIMKDDLFSGWFNYTKEFEKAATKEKANILLVKYEDLKLKPISTVKEIATFLEVPFTDTFISDIVDRCSFQKLKGNKHDSTTVIHPEQKSTLFRKGCIGDWKNWFTVAQNEKFDEIFRSKMNGCDVEFIYEE